MLEIKYFVYPTSKPQILAVECIKFIFIEVIFEYIRKINAKISSLIYYLKTLSLFYSVVGHLLVIWVDLPLHADVAKAAGEASCIVAPKYLMTEWRMVNESVRLTSATISKHARQHVIKPQIAWFRQNYRWVLYRAISALQVKLAGSDFIRPRPPQGSCRPSVLWTWRDQSLDFSEDDCRQWYPREEWHKKARLWNQDWVWVQFCPSCMTLNTLNPFLHL